MEATPRNEWRRSVEEHRKVSTDLTAAYQQPVEDVIAALEGSRIQKVLKAVQNSAASRLKKLSKPQWPTNRSSVSWIRAILRH